MTSQLANKRELLAQAFQVVLKEEMIKKEKKNSLKMTMITLNEDEAEI